MRGDAVAIAATLSTPSAVSRMAWIRIGFSTACLRLELGEQLVEIVDVPRPLDLGQHDDVELVADRADDLDDVVEHPGRIERVDARPQAGRAEVVRLRHRDEARARRLLGVGRDRVLEIAEHHVDLRDQLRHLGAQLLDVRRHEMDHALELDRQLAQRRRRADRERLEEIARQLHRSGAVRLRKASSTTVRASLRRRQAAFDGNGRGD